jgi:SAM-dependent methyltransferase
LEAVVLQLARTLRGLPQRKLCTEWGEYYADTNYTDDAMRTKVGLVRDYLAAVDPAPRLAMDLGANTGRFSRLAAERAATVVAWDIDPLAVQGNYLALRTEGRHDVLPLLQDLTNPSPALGWAHAERASFLERGPADVVLALAVIHHLAITNNVPLPLLADFMAAGARHLIIEFVPKADSQVQRLLARTSSRTTTWTASSAPSRRASRSCARRPLRAACARYSCSGAATTPEPGRRERRRIHGWRNW